MDILPTISHEAQVQCNNQGVTLPSSLITLYIRTQLLAIGKRDITGNVELRPDLVDRIISESVDVLTKGNEVMVETLRFQSSIIELQDQQVNAFRTYKIKHKAKSHQYMEDICNKKDLKDVTTCMSLYILHESNLLDENEMSGMSISSGLTGASISDISKSESIMALESVLPKSQIDSFVAQTDSEKCNQLEEIWRIVWGIRLYNKETLMGGSDIPSLLGCISAELTSVINGVLNLLSEMQVLTNQYSAVLSSPSVNISDIQRKHIRDEYIHYLQVYVYLKSLLDNIHTLTHKVKEHTDKWRASVAEATQLVSGSMETPVPKSDVYPKFINLSDRWDNLLGLQREISNVTEFFNFIICAATSDVVRPTIKKLDISNLLLSIATERKPNLQLLSTEIGNMSRKKSEYGDIEYIGGDADPNTRNPKNERIHFEFNGFCIVSFVDSGMLLFGNKAQCDHPDIDFGAYIGQPTDYTSPLHTEARKSAELCPGYIHVHNNNAYYSFTNERCLRTFVKDPSRYLSQSMIELLTKSPAAVVLLGMDIHLPTEAYLPGTRTHEVLEVAHMDEGTQTGQIDPYKDHRYIFSEWELRRRVVHLANLRNKRTKSVQTTLSHFRRDNDTQAYQPKEQTTQTMMDAAIQPPIVRQYIKGLRGTHTSEIETVQRVFLY